MAREDLHFRLRISESLKRRVQAAGAASGRSITAEIIARLEASFALDDVQQLAGSEEGEDLLAMLADIDGLRTRLVRSYRRRNEP